MSTRPIIETLNRIAGGTFMDKAAEELAELVKSVDVTGKKGSLTLTISIEKATHAGAMIVGAKTKLALPASPKMDVLLFGTPEGNLLKDDPSQMQLPLTSVLIKTTQIA
jgi:hypothetical protein